MITNEQIEEAQESIFEDKFLNNEVETLYYDNEDSDPVYTGDQIKEAIGLGAHWAIEKFIKSLWHDASEEPKDYNEWIIFRCDNFDYVGTHLTRDYGDWGSMVEIWESFHWCYLSDILPKEGGEE